MSLFADPAEHTANPPASWQVVKCGTGCWKLQTTGGTVLDGFTTRKAASAARETGWLVTLYDQEARWYAGEQVANWRAWAVVKAENERNAARQAAYWAKLADRAVQV